ncbi:YceI family protein [Rhodohalobacter mucosus]|uniref:Lipid/polyisoprenoid-binding YceI-like domain-containing protein n=1 Tax=Rhodohalobacter mucosus TaxID=2079485 RepID=A0A316TMR6_9BACT|nr:YceI family protein [Rhodohalobacter mucosus]PWN05903.1 hypothetical protein DDZ15_12005 [Rhodohalobacter mucosus]
MWTLSILLLNLFLNGQPVFQTSLSDSVLVSPESSITVTGSSTLHDWDAVSSNIELSADLPESWFQSEEEWNTEALTGIVAEMPIESLESGRRKMNRDIREALRSEQYPKIRFTSSVAEVLSYQKENGVYEFRLNGNLALAGEERDTQFVCTIDEHENQTLRATCETDIDMTDFNINPPTAFFGALKTDEMVTIMVDLILLSSRGKD